MKWTNTTQNIHELNAIRIRYDKPLTKKDILSYAMVPGLYLSILTYTLFLRWWVIPLSFLVGAIYSISVLLPKSIECHYQRKAFRERNRFINNLSQSIHRKNSTMVDALLDVATTRLKGELRDDILKLANEIKGAEESVRKEAYERLITKYNHDRIFVQYIEHLLTVDLNGKINLAALDETSLDHDKSVEWQERLIERKGISKIYFILNSCLAYLLILGAAYLMRGTYSTSFAHSLVGLIIGGGYLAFTLYYDHKFITEFFDETVMEVRF